MKVLIKNIAKIFIIFILTVTVLNGLNNVFSMKDSISQFRRFYEADYGFDVLFLGNSHFYNGISPLEIWHDYGITSYNMGIPGARYGLLYWEMKNAMTHHKPKLVVINCAYIYTDTKIHNIKEYNHRFYDYLPTGITKIETALDLYSGDWRNAFREVVFPFSRYHNRWNDLGKNDFDPDINNFMGFSYLLGTEDIHAFPAFTTDDIHEVNTVGTMYLQKMIKECQEQGIEILLTVMPFNVSRESQNDISYLSVIADEYGVNYLTPDELISVLDIHKDYHNHTKNNSHLNLAGALKCTEFIGSYITEHYKLPDHRDDQNYGIWDTYYQNYAISRDKALKEMLSDAPK